MKTTAGDGRGAVLLALARETLEHRMLAAPAALDDETPAAGAIWLREPGATFVTLEKKGRLRGCVGSLEPLRPLIIDVRRNALAAAFEDTRFPPVEPSELAELSIEVTLLAPRVVLDCRSERDAIAQLRPRVDGVLLTYGSRRATFLPQVWDELPSPPHFLAALKEKAGLDRGFWNPSIVIERYTVESWSEVEEGAGGATT